MTDRLHCAEAHKQGLGELFDNFVNRIKETE
jgi:hypothetical protein